MLILCRIGIILAKLVLLTIFVWNVSAVTRTFVASYGDNGNPCSLQMPCRSFSTALAMTDSGGEIVALDSAGYGGVTIDRSVTIVAIPGIYAVIPATSGAGVTIDTAGVDVTLRGLTIAGYGGSFGVLFSSGSRLSIENCLITNMITDGLNVTAADSKTTVKDSVFRGSGNVGVNLSGSMTVVLDNVQIERNGMQGILVSSGANLRVVRNTITNNGGSGIAALTTGGTSSIVVEGSLISDNMASGIGVLSGPGLDVRVNLSAIRNTISKNSQGISVGTLPGGSVSAFVTDSMISENIFEGMGANTSPVVLVASRNTVVRNGFGFIQAGGATFYSRQDNTVVDNATNISGTVTPLGGS